MSTNRRVSHRQRAKSMLLAVMISLVIITGSFAGLSITPQESADRLFQQGIQHYQNQNYGGAIEVWQTALKQYEQLGDRAAITTTLKNLSTVLTQMADQAARQEKYATAVQGYGQALTFAEAWGDRNQIARILGNRAIIDKNLGNYSQSINANQKALILLKEVNNKSAEMQILSNLGNAYEAIGDYTRANENYEASLALAKTLGSSASRAIALNNLGGIAANLKVYDQALKYFQESLEISQSLPDRAIQASVLINLGSTYHATNQRQQARDYYQQALGMAQAIGNHPRQSEALSSLGLLLEEEGQFAAALERHRQALAIAQALGNPQLLGRSLNNLGHALLGAGKLSEAETVLRQAVKQLDGLRPGLNDAYQVSIFDTQLNTYNLLMQVLVAANQPEAALEASEQGRARAFAERLAQRTQGCRGRDCRLQALPPITRSDIRRIAQTQQATLVEYAIVPDDDFKFRAKQRARAAKLLIWVVQPNGTITLRQVDLQARWQRGTLTQLVAAARCLAPAPICPTVAEMAQNSGTRGSGSASPPRSPQASPPPASEGSESISALDYPGLPELHQVLIQPIADLLPQQATDRVIFLPQESLFLVPFAALPDATGKYLIETHTILTAPSIQVLDLTWQSAIAPQAAAPTALVVGNPDPMPGELSPLPAAEREAIQVAQILGTPPLLRKQATRRQILTRLGSASLIHFATHGILESDQLDSLVTPGAIAFAPSSGDSGFLTAEEILQLQVKAKLVVLSACDTGRGTITGDGVLGLSRSWIAAGVPSVVVSLWAVNDESTAALMVEFYRSRQHTPDHAVALRQAMLKTMQTYPQPKDWAAFVLVGH